MKLNNFMYGLTLMQMLYDIEMEDEDYEEIALLAWKLIGNKRVRSYRYTTCDYNDDGSITLPCNAEIIEGVSMGGGEGAGASLEDGEGLTNYLPGPNPHSVMAERYIERRKAFRHPLYLPGKFIKYERVGDRLYFDRPHGPITILYRGELLDDDGLPEVTDKEAMALATYCAYVTKFKEGMATNNAQIVQMAELLKQKWLGQVDQARSDYYLSQNEWDELLDSRVNWDRKQFNKSYKLYR